MKSGVCLRRPLSVHHSAWLEAGSRQRGRGRFSAEPSKVKLKEQGAGGRSETTGLGRGFGRKSEAWEVAGSAV